MAFFDNDVPPLAGGTWYLSVSHSIKDGDTPVAPPFGAAQEIVVSAPQVAIDATAVVQTFPPATATGTFGDVLPHIVLSDPQLPWERLMAGGEDPRQPWVALLVFAGDELEGATTSSTRVTTTTAGQFLAPDTAVLKPSITLEPDIDPSTPCAFVQVPTDVFQTVTPRLDELRFLAHCRQVDVGAKPELGLVADGLFSVVVANRFPAPPPPGSADGAVAPAFAHLVSLEGLGPVLVDDPDFGGHTSVAMLSLASWAFSVQAEAGTDFRDLAAGLVASETVDGAQDPDRLLLRLPPPPPPTGRNPDRWAAYAPPAAASPAEAEAADRLAAGFVPLEYRARTGEATVAWYRGPFSPVPTGPLPGAPTFTTADAAMAYAPAFGVFDLSLAGAFEIGRALALSDRTFGQALLDLRRRAHGVAGELLGRLESDHFSATQIGEVARTTSVHDEFGALLDQQLLADVGMGPAPVAPDVPPWPSPPPGPDADPAAALAAFLADPSVQQQVLTAVEDDLDPVATWLGNLMLLGPVPFVALVADEALLPSESLRFSYLDRNWVGALVDGAMSIGLDSSLAGFYAELTRGIVVDAAYDAARVQRDVLVGRPGAGPGPDDGRPITGLLLRSALVSGWPTLEISAADATGAPVPPLRIAHLSPSVLLCLFWGVPASVSFAEPSEGLRFGTDDDGVVGLRNPTAPANGGSPLAAPLTGAAPFPVIDFSGREQRQLRDLTHRVLNLAPGSSTGMLAQLAGALSTALGTTVGPLGPADLAVQLVAAPDAVTFASPRSTPEPPHG
jgi:hypothetical protein